MADSVPDPVVSFEPEPADAVRAAVLAGLRAYNRRHAEAPDFRPLVLAARSADGVIIAGLVGDTGWRWLHIDLLWVIDGHRGRGLGRRLLHAAEDEGRARGAGYAYLDTFDFQARPFYEREGYTVFGVQDDFPPGHQRFFMRKDLSGSLHRSRSSDSAGL
jgi:GNAT superfamily N-acetyltransferase